MKLLLPLIFFGLAATIVTATGNPVADATAAIKKARFVCRLEQPVLASGRWQAIFRKNAKFGDEWHVWFGNDSKEPVCGFYGAIVKVDGSYTACEVSACKMVQRKPKSP